MSTRRSPYDSHPGRGRRSSDHTEDDEPISSGAAAAVGSLFGRALGSSSPSRQRQQQQQQSHRQRQSQSTYANYYDVDPHRHPYVSSDLYNSDALSVSASSSTSSMQSTAQQDVSSGAGPPSAYNPSSSSSSSPHSRIASLLSSLPRRILDLAGDGEYYDDDGGGGDSQYSDDNSRSSSAFGKTNNVGGRDASAKRKSLLRVVLATALLVSALYYRRASSRTVTKDSDIVKPDFIYEHPYVTSSYYTSTKSIKTLLKTDKMQVQPNKKEESRRLAAGEPEQIKRTRLAIVRPFCAFDAGPLPTTFACWNSLSPCKAGSRDLGDVDEYWNGTASTDGEGDAHYFDNVGSDIFSDAVADLFLFYSQTFSENEEAIRSCDAIIDEYLSPGGWSNCFENIYAIEANIPEDLDLYIPSAQEELYNWVNGPNRQFEAAFRIIQSGEWGDYDGFYLMEGDSIPIKNHWLDVVLSQVEVHRPFAILGAQYDGDKWDQFYEQIPISLLHHTNGNAIYNTSHPLMERLVGQLEVEAPCPYNSIPYDYRMSQMWVEGTLELVPELAPRIMLNEEGENITLSNNTAMFMKWAAMYKDEDPFKYTKVIHNYAATNLIPRHLGPEYIIHGAKLYSPWDPVKIGISLVVSEWFFDRSEHLLSTLDRKDHPFSEVVVMLPPNVEARDDYDEMSVVPIRAQHRTGPDFMDLCEAEIETEWFMITNSYHHVANHVDLMFTPGALKPVVPFTPATYPFCFKFPYCKENVNLAQRFNPGHDKVVQDMDMLFHTATRNKFCAEWKEKNGDEGEDLYKFHKRRLQVRKKIVGPAGPTGTDYSAYLIREGLDGKYKFTDRSLYGARSNFIKIFAKEEKLDGLSDSDMARRTRLLGSNTTSCDCSAYETQEACEGSELKCAWRPLFDSCHPPEMMDNGAPICPQTDAPTMAPTVSLENLETMVPTTSPTKAPVDTASARRLDPWYASMFKTREQDDGLDVEDEEKAPSSAPGDKKRRRLSVVDDTGDYYSDSVTGNITNHKDETDTYKDRRKPAMAPVLPPSGMLVAEDT